MAGSASVSYNAGTGVATVTGSGYSGSEILVTVEYVSTDGKRRYAEQYRIPVVAGAIDYSVRVPFTSGTATVRTRDLAGAVQASPAGQAV